MPIHLRELQPNTRFLLLRTRQKYTYLGKKPSIYSGLLVHAVIKEHGDGKQTTLHHSCHVKPIIRIEHDTTY